MSERRVRPYPTDLSDAEWSVLEPLLPPPARTGRPLKWSRRLMAEAIFYLVRSGCAWRLLPRHFPPLPTVYAQLARWRRDCTVRRMHDRLREQAREADGRSAEPSAAVIGSQMVRATGVGGVERGYDAAKKTVGRKRHILVDAAGLVLAADARHHGCASPPARGGRKAAQRGQRSAAVALGRSRGGFSTKLHVRADANGMPLAFALTGGERHDLTAVPELLEGVRPAGTL